MSNKDNGVLPVQRKYQNITIALDVHFVIIVILFYLWCLRHFIFKKGVPEIPIKRAGVTFLNKESPIDNG